MIYVVGLTRAAAVRACEQAGISLRPEVVPDHFGRIAKIRRVILVNTQTDLRGRKLVEEDQVICLEGSERRADYTDIMRCFWSMGLKADGDKRLTTIAIQAWCHCDNPIYEADDYLCDSCRGA